MKTIVILAATALVAVGCNQRDSKVGDTSRRDQIEQSKDAQQAALNEKKESIENSADRAQREVSAQAKAEKQRIEAEADARQAQVDAQKREIAAEARADKADLAANQRIDEAAGAFNEKNYTGKTEGDRSLAEKIRDSFKNTFGADKSDSAKNVKVMSLNGKVTLTGTVSTQAQKDNMEEQVKKVPGVTSVDNQLEVK